MGSEIRVRFAPSPTGKPHVGNLRTALFNWLFARRYGGEFILRVEDTDRDRYVEGTIEAILDSLRWLGLDWDEGPEVGGQFGPYLQSQRLEIYQGVAQDLIDGGHAYRCYCSRERLDEVRREQQQTRSNPGYDRRCRNLTAEEGKKYADQGVVPVVRFKMPPEGSTTVDDLIRGEVTWENELLDDFIILKSDGFPTYHMANVVDDHRMKISHVLRAEEWLPSTPRHLELYRALGYEPPLFAHLPMILGPDRAKLSKRHGASFILDYRDEGFLPEVMVNFMVLLGWSLDDKTDIMSRDVLVENFSLDRIGHAGAIFDKEKLLWMNGAYIRQLGQDDLAERMMPFLERDLPAEIGAVDMGYLRRIVPLAQERLKTLGDAAGLTSYFFEEDIDYDPGQLIQKGMDIATTLGGLRRAHEVLGVLEPFDSHSIEEALRSTCAELELSGRQFFGVLRVAATGRTAAPPLFETLDVLGRGRCLKRIESAVQRLESEGSTAGSAGPVS